MRHGKLQFGNDVYGKKQDLIVVSREINLEAGFDLNDT